MRSAPDELSHRNRAETPLEPALHEPGEDEHTVAALDHSLTQRKLRGEELATECGGNLTAERGTALSVGAFHLRQVECGVTSLDRQAEKQMLQDEIVQNDDA